MRKKIILILCATSCFLLGCAKDSSLTTVRPQINPPQTFEVMFPQTVVNQKPKIDVNIGTGIILSELSGKVPNEISFTSTEEDRENGRKWSLVSGYTYTYTYSDLGIKITTPSLYEPYFFQLTLDPIFERGGNIVYKSGATNQGGEYIQMFKKDPAISLRTTIERKHLGTGCIAYNRLDEDSDYDYTKDSRFQIHGRNGIDTRNFFNVTGPGGSLGSDIACRPDMEYPDNYSSIFFVQPLAHKDRYYKISMGDACAPGPCSIFGKIEFF